MNYIEEYKEILLHILKEKRNEVKNRLKNYLDSSFHKDITNIEFERFGEYVNEFTIIGFALTKERLELFGIEDEYSSTVTLICWKDFTNNRLNQIIEFYKREDNAAGDDYIKDFFSNQLEILLLDIFSEIRLEIELKPFTYYYIKNDYSRKIDLNINDNKPFVI